MSTGYTRRDKGKTTVVYGNSYQDGQSAAMVYLITGAPVNGTSGTLAGIAPPGALMIRTDSVALYQNTNTKASPTWSAAPLSGAAGVTSGTIDGAVIGGSTPAAATHTTLAVTGLMTNSVGTGITAAATQTQVAATALTKQFNKISTCAHSGDGVKLAALTPGEWQVVFNDGANPAAVYGNGASDNIDAAGAAASVPLANGARALFVCTATNVIESALLGAKSA